MNEPPSIYQLQNDFLKALPKSAFLSIAGLLMCSFLLGNYYEEYEPFFDAFYSGIFTPGVPFRSWYYMAHIGLGEVYARMYEWLPGIEWMSWLMHAYLATALSIWLALAYVIVKPKFGLLPTLLIQLLLLIILAADNVVNFNYTRISYLLCGSALWGLLMLVNNRLWQRSNSILYFVFIALYVLGALTRVEPSISVWLLACVFGFLWTQSLSKTIITLLVPAFVTVAIVAGIYYDISHTTEFYKQIEPDLEYQCNGANVVPISNMKSQRDSVLYEAAIEKLWADPLNLTIPFIESLILKPTGRQKWDLKLMHIRMELLPYIEYYMGPLLITWLIALYLIAQPVFNKHYGAVGRILLFVLGFLAILLLQTYFKKMRIRSFSPMFSMYLFSLFCFFWAHRKTIRWSLLALIILAGFQLYLTWQQVQIHRQSRVVNRQIYKAVQQFAQGQVILLNAKSFGNFTQQHQPFTPFNLNGLGKVYVNEAHVMSLIRPYRIYLEKECNCNVSDFSAFYKYLLRKGERPKVFLLTDAKRMDLTARYLQVIHNLQLHYQLTPLYLPLGWEMSLINRQQLHLYELKEITLYDS